MKAESFAAFWISGDQSRATIVLGPEIGQMEEGGEGEKRTGKG
jgi:hypothetical protein